MKRELCKVGAQRQNGGGAILFDYKIAYLVIFLRLLSRANCVYVGSGKETGLTTAREGYEFFTMQWFVWFSPCRFEVPLKQRSCYVSVASRGVT